MTTETATQRAAPWPAGSSTVKGLPPGWDAVATGEAGTVLCKTDGSVEDRMMRLFRRCLTRPPDTEEVADLAQFFESQLARFESGELDAAAVAGQGDSDPASRAAWTVTARVLMNLDEFVMRP